MSLHGSQVKNQHNLYGYFIASFFSLYGIALFVYVRVMQSLLLMHSLLPKQLVYKNMNTLEQI